MITYILSWFRPKRETPIRRTGPIARVDLDVFDMRGRRSAYVMVGCSLFLGRAANRNGGGEAA